MDTPPIQYTQTEDDVSIAYSSMGISDADGPSLLLSVPPMGSHLQEDWQFAPVRRYYQQLARSLNLIRLDHRGGGLSGHASGRYSPEHFALDIDAVADALELDKLVLWGSGRSTATVISYAVTHPERVCKLVLWMPLISGIAHGESVRTKALHSAEKLDPAVANAARGSLLIGNENTESTSELIEFIGKVRAAADPEVIKASESFEVQPLLAKVTVPTLILTRREARYDNESTSRTTAAAIAKAQLAVLGGQSALPYLSNYHEVVDRTVNFITGRAGLTQTSNRSTIRLILFTDVEASTALTDRFGDAKARNILRQHESIVREAMRYYGGDEIKTMGDGFMLSFNSASSAIDAAIAMQKDIQKTFTDQETAIRIRIGIHAGEPIAEGDDLHGTAVIRAARIMAEAKGEEILTSDVVRYLVDGKGYRFTDHGQARLKGFEEPQRLYAVHWQSK